MPVHRYRTVAEMPPPPPRPALDPDNLRLAFEWSETLLRLDPRRVPGGVYRRDLREAQREDPVAPTRGTGFATDR